MRHTMYKSKTVATWHILPDPDCDRAETPNQSSICVIRLGNFYTVSTIQIGSQSMDVQSQQALVDMDDPMTELQDQLELLDLTMATLNDSESPFQSGLPTLIGDLQTECDTLLKAKELLNASPKTSPIKGKFYTSESHASKSRP
jgi:hypothetical protein